MRLTAFRLRWILIICLAILTALHIIYVLIDLGNVGLKPRSLVWLFDFDSEYNLPSSYNGLLLAASGAAAWWLAWRNSRHIQGYWWLGLGVIFFFLAFDEVLLIHEQVAMPIRNALALDNSSPFFHAWVIPAIALILFLGLYLLYVFTRKGGFGFAPNKIIFYLFLLSAGVIAIEVIGTKTYVDIAFYRLVSVPIEEVYEIALSSIILYNLAKEIKIKA